MKREGAENRMRPEYYERDYGVVLTADKRKVDEAATAQQRRELKNAPT